MRGQRVGPDEGRPNGVDKHVPPAFLARRERGGFPRRWWSGLTAAGRWTVLVIVILLVALVAGLSMSLAGSNTAGKVVKRHPEAPISHKKTTLYSFSANSSRIDTAVLASGLVVTIEAMSRTSAQLQKDLEATFGDSGDPFPKARFPVSGGNRPAPEGAPDGVLTASLDVLADGPDGAQPDISPSPASEIGQRYIARYREYLSLLTLIRGGAESIPAAGGPSFGRPDLLKACDELMRDTSVIIAGLERLGADPDEDGIIATGIGAANTRIQETSKRVDQLMDALGRALPATREK